jgi:GTPase SAR1 family protein
MTDNVRILVLGDAGVGKTSIIDTYITHYFSADLPAVMVDSLIPKDATTNGVNATIMDSSVDPDDRNVLLHKIRVADSIIAVYDVSRLETLENLKSEWLPFIEETSQALSERCKPVIIAANKTDLHSQDEEVERAQLIEILERFSFVQLCDRCSAKSLDVDKVFYHSESAISFPMEPLYDYRQETFTYPAKLALIRVFRAMDVDKDGILEDSDVDNLQQICFGSPFATNDLNELKKQVCKTTAGSPDLMDKNRFKFLGFLELMRSSVERLQLQNPWIILRKFGYDNNMNLIIPEYIFGVPDNLPSQATELSVDAYEFLINLAFGAIENTLIWCTPDDDVADSGERESPTDATIWKSGNPILTAKALNRILCIMSADVQHPWRAPLVWRQGSESYLLSGAIETVSEDNMLSYAYTLDTWMTHWQMLAVFRPIETQELLYRLGYSKLFQQPSQGSDESESSQSPDSYDYGLTWRDRHASTRTIKVGIFGADGIGKKAFVCELSGYTGSKGDMLDTSTLALGSHPGALYGGCSRQLRDVRYAATVSSDNREARRQSLLRKPNVFMIAAAVSYSATREWLAVHGKSLDVAIMMYSLDNENATAATFDAVLDMEALVPSEVPRVFVGNQSDSSRAIPPADTMDSVKTEGRHAQSVLNETSKNVSNRAKAYLSERHAEVPFMQVSTTSQEGIEDVVKRLINIASMSTNDLSSSRTSLTQTALIWGLSLATLTGLTVYVSRDDKLRRDIGDIFGEARSICFRFFKQN